ncbi:hypothetical protein GCM10010347_31360 [Streptomyces cirratus]|uniref:Hypervirulence associated protein TUDOR domain-containing protein n=1 Tax=Streptomyces cirratus TaxID=68187 RepID=A0ABQ3ESY5_9ACTN|nr:hypothetical protein GCM10010347_31360 [Streptomyces cirratus]
MPDAATRDTRSGDRVCWYVRTGSTTEVTAEPSAEIVLERKKKRKPLSFLRG